MFLVSDNNTVAAKVAIVVVTLLGVITVGGCARPHGTLFSATRAPRVWPAPPAAARIKLTGTISDSRDLQAAVSGKEVFASAFRGKRPPIHLSGPHSVSIRNRNQVAVADPAARAVHLLNLESRDHIIVSGFGNELFKVPIGVAWAGDQLFVTDAERHEVIELNSRGAFRKRFGSDRLKRPVGIAYDSVSDALFVVDGGSHQLLVFDRSGKLMRTIGRRGDAPGEFNYPSHVCVAGDHIIVADSGNFRVQLLTRDGAAVRTIGQKGNGAGDFALPKGVAVDSVGNIYVVDAQFENIQVFDQTGQLLMAFGEEGTAGGEFWLPAGIAIDKQDRIWVADTGNRRLQLFSCIRPSL